mmetsp:Transcript_50775/g.74268  ORF Transcript_50775/g.74268 Transcript_50775/m.74268 type:complete len:269 (-) Transcript_50775:25-831(-)
MVMAHTWTWTRRLLCWCQLAVLILCSGLFLQKKDHHSFVSSFCFVSNREAQGKIASCRDFFRQHRLKAFYYFNPRMANRHFDDANQNSVQPRQEPSLKTGQLFPILGKESLMCQKQHGTSANPVQQSLRFGVDRQKADKICNFNRESAEIAGYFYTVSFFSKIKENAETTFYDSNTGKPLFLVPKGRSFADFQKETVHHGWPSFRDEEVCWENVRVIPDQISFDRDGFHMGFGECVSIDGTHLGHNIPDKKGNRYCINLVSIAGNPFS